jgi:hypothetical protein
VEVKYQDIQFQTKRQQEQRDEVVRKLQEQVQQEKRVGVLLQQKLKECFVELEELQATEQKLAESISGKEKLVCPLPSSLIPLSCLNCLPLLPLDPREHLASPRED